MMTTGYHIGKWRTYLYALYVILGCITVCCPPCFNKCASYMCLFGSACVLALMHIGPPGWKRLRDPMWNRWLWEKRMFLADRRNPERLVSSLSNRKWRFGINTVNFDSCQVTYACKVFMWTLFIWFTCNSKKLGMLFKKNKRKERWEKTECDHLLMFFDIIFNW